MKRLTEEDLEFRVHTMNLLHEIADHALPSAGKMGIFFQPLNTFKNLLARVAQRATELNDPELNILMLKLTLYDVPNKEIGSAIKKQRKLLKP